MNAALDRALLIRDAFRYLDRNGFADGADYIETTALEFEATLTAEAAS